MTVLAAHTWKSNAELIADVHALGYLHDEDTIWDCTYGRGTFWKVWRPKYLIGTDITPGLTPCAAVDFTSPPSEWLRVMRFGAIVMDPPYKLNGTPDPYVDERYGVHKATTWQDRMQLIRDGITATVPCLKVGGIYLLKCQDQVCSGAIRWQTIEFTLHAKEQGLELIDRFDLLGKHRPQPMEGRTQKHAHGRGSTLLVFRKTR